MEAELLYLQYHNNILIWCSRYIFFIIAVENGISSLVNEKIIDYIHIFMLQKSSILNVLQIIS